MALRVGSDPEAFLRDSNNNLVSALDFLPGSKHDPFKTDHGSIQPDNILAEFNSQPASSIGEFIANHKLILSDLNQFLQPLDLHLDFIASALADDSLLWHPAARQSGCEPDYCAWESFLHKGSMQLGINIPAPYGTSNMRAAGGHLHISFDQADNDPEMVNRIKFIKALDYNLGVASLLHDSDTTRRGLYGKAGAFRPKLIERGDPYNGAEYRTLSNFWLKSEALMAWVFQQVQDVYDNLDELADKAEHYHSSIVKIINNSLFDEAKIFCKNEGIAWEV